MEEIKIRALSRPETNNLEELINWLCNVFDLDKTQEDIFKEVTKYSLFGKGVTSKELNTKLLIPRSTVIYKLNRMIEYGFIVKKGRRYFLARNSLKETIRAVDNAIDRQINDIIDIADKIDKLVIDYGRTKRSKSK